ncbi:MAG: N-formylglutamate deformylase [Methylobacteriaceae bacterium]|nr:N-formylglutamate deformylase [Methylobacteriaceae bacterium]
MSFIIVEPREAPLILSIPHAGTEIPEEIASRLVSMDLALKDTDWWMAELYGFARDLGATVLRTTTSRTVIDVNRDPSGASLYPGQATTGLVPTETFDGEPLYRAGLEPDAGEVAARRQTWFEPYHAALAAQIERLRARHRRLVLYDCHSIRSRVPRFFAVELPVFNIGTNEGRSAEGSIVTAVETVCRATGQPTVVDGRFKGGWITRHYGRPQAGVEAIQMELAQRFYMDEAKPDPEPLSKKSPLPTKAWGEGVIGAFAEMGGGAGVGSAERMDAAAAILRHILDAVLEAIG